MARRRGGYKGLAASYKRRAKREMTNFIYTALGGESTDKRISRKNPTTGNFIKATLSDGEYYYDKGRYSAAKPKKERVSRAKMVRQADEAGIWTKVWDSARQAEENSDGEFKASGIQKACREGKIYKGYRWEYLEN